MAVSEFFFAFDNRYGLDGDLIHADPGIAFLHNGEEPVNIHFFSLDEHLDDAVRKISDIAGQIQPLRIQHAETAETYSLNAAFHKNMISLHILPLYKL